MSLINSLFETLDGAFAAFGKFLRQDARMYCNLETADSKFNLVTKDGNLLSIIKLEGYQRFIGSNEFAFLSERLAEAFQPAFASGGHVWQFYFSYSADGIREQIDQAMTASKQTAKKIKLEVDDIFESRVDTLERFCSVECCYLVLWTTKECFNGPHIKHLTKTHAKNLGKHKIPHLSKAQSLHKVLNDMRHIHNSFVQTILEDIVRLGFYASMLPVHDAVKAIRETIDPAFTGDGWKPYLPGDKIPVHFSKEKKKKDDLSFLMYPPLDGMIVPRDGENLSLKYAKLGDKIYAPIYIELLPKDIRPFYDLFRRLLGGDLPWRIAFYVSPGGMEVSKSKNLLAQFLTFSSHYNKLIVEAHRMLKELDQRSDDPIIKFTVVLTTWADAGDEPALQARVAKLSKTVQSWGGCEVRQVSGDPFELMMSSALAMDYNTNCTTTAAPLSEAITMMPYVRPASPWPGGAILFRTPDGKVWPFQPGSKQQVSWIDLIFARSGSGKSVLSSVLNLGLLLSPGLSVLPRIAIIDIGPSSKGFISLLQEGLPKERRHHASYRKLTMDECDAINPFDTQLGSRYPTRSQRSFLINFLGLLLVDDIEDRPFEGAGSMLSMIVDETYKHFSDAEQPRVFVPGSVPEIEAACKEHNISLEEGTSWWQIADALFEKDILDIALKAQRQAMPTLADTISMCHHHSIKDLFAKVTTDTGEDYVSAYCRIIAGVIQNYPTLTAISQLDLEGARVVSLDLQDVARTGSSSANKQTAIMYMLARHILAQDFFLHSSDVEKFPKQYHKHHMARIKEIMEEPKRIVFDEFHRTSRSPVIRDQILQDMREGRKWKTHVALASQSLSDFDPLMVEFATSVFILDAGTSKTINQVCETFGLSETEKVALSTRVHGPSSSGATFIAQFVTKKGLNTQLLTSTISPVELWAFNTTTEDVAIRDTLYQEIGPVNARKMLAKRFPSGSAVDDVEVELKMDATRTVSEVCDSFVIELTQAYRKQKRQEQLFGKPSRGK